MDNNNENLQNNTQCATCEEYVKAKEELEIALVIVALIGPIIGMLVGLFVGKKLIGK